MNIFENLHESIEIRELYGKMDKARDAEVIAELKKYTKCDIPQELIEFLHDVSGMEFVARRSEEEYDYTELAFYDIDDIIWFVKYQPDSMPLGSDDMLPFIDDMGYFVLFYGNGKEGFGIYYATLRAMNYDESIKVANNLKELLVDGAILKVKDL